MVSMVQISRGEKVEWYDDYGSLRLSGVLLESGKSSDVRRNIPSEWKESWEEFLSQEQILVWKKTKKSEKRS